MLDTAAAMFGPGFVWLVWARTPGGGVASASSEKKKGAWKILTTYLAGTPYPEAGYRRQGLDMNTSNATSASNYYNAEPTNFAGAFGAHSRAGKEGASIPPGGTTLVPVLCVNTWEHVYIYDFGLAGKRKFLADWWECVDWHVVEGNAPREAKERGGGFARG